jgi:hypothetical protein
MEEHSKDMPNKHTTPTCSAASLEPSSGLPQSVSTSVTPLRSRLATEPQKRQNKEEQPLQGAWLERNTVGRQRAHLVGVYVKVTNLICFTDTESPKTSGIPGKCILNIPSDYSISSDSTSNGSYKLLFRDALFREYDA